MTPSRAIAAVAAAAFALAAPAGARPRPPVTTLHVGEEFVASGQTGTLPGRVRRATGLVVIRGKWGGGRYHVITTTRTDAAGRYRFVIRPRHRGVLTLRIFPPDKQNRRLVLRVL